MIIYQKKLELRRLLNREKKQEISNIFCNITEVVLHDKIFKRFYATDLFISEEGEVVSWNGIRDMKILKPAIVQGYYVIRNMYVHYMVFAVWIGNPIRNGNTIGHRDSNKFNNKSSNLIMQSQRKNLENYFRNSLN
jgi:hypothetical protein